MSTFTLQHRMAYLLLVLVGLVGGLGTGLHDVFHCGHHCQCGGGSDVCCIERTVAEPPALCDCGLHHDDPRDAGPAPAQHASLVRAEGDCAICQLLSHFNTTVTATLWQHSVYGNRDQLAMALPTVVVSSSVRLEPSRGPPAAVNVCA